HVHTPPSLVGVAPSVRAPRLDARTIGEPSPLTGRGEDHRGVIRGDRAHVVHHVAIARRQFRNRVDVFVGHAGRGETGGQTEALTEAVDGAGRVVGVAECLTDGAHLVGRGGLVVR